MAEVLTNGTNGLGRPSHPHGWVRRRLRSTIHFLSYQIFLKRRATIVSRAAGFRLTVPPTVFHPRVFLTSEYPLWAKALLLSVIAAGR